MSVFRHPQATPGRNYGNEGMRMPKPPERPLQPYMRYSRKMWPRVRAENPEAQLWDIGKIIGKMWSETTDAERSIYQHEYELEKAEYEKQMKNFQNSGFGGYMTAKGRAKNNEKMSRSRMDAGGVVIQPVDEDDGTNELSTRRIAGLRFERNNRLISDLFSANMVTDLRTIVAHNRMEMLKKQAASLAQHQSKLEEELIKLQAIHNDRKRAIEKGSDEFQEKMKKVVSEKPVIDEEKFQETVKEWEGKLAEAYVEYKKKQDEINAKAAANKESAPVLRNLVMGSPSQNGDKEKTDEEKVNGEEKVKEEENESEKKEEKDDEKNKNKEETATEDDDKVKVEMKPEEEAEKKKNEEAPSKTEEEPAKEEEAEKPKEKVEENKDEEKVEEKMEGVEEQKQ
ncbi:unnamed protein product [Caenorhabditis bovis]|uniref:HMG box domain-containing protein n=1 Tax=Caenorhabditis bovis TaxID=2654633 RepID=A0A8S1EX33_9PELO|nr:unnamed protein product [Caenorhabditis bovis]